MSLVIYGQENTTILRKWAEDLFSLVPNKEVSLPKYEIPHFNNNMAITKVIPVKEEKSLRLI